MLRRLFFSNVVGKIAGTERLATANGKKVKEIIREFSFILLYLNIQIKKRIPSIKYGFFHPRSAGQVLNTYTTI